jgi:hypothetical protein
MITLILVGCALGYLFWPRPTAGIKSPVPAPADLFRVPPMQPVTPAPASPDARAAIDSLLEVRDTLGKSGDVDPESSKAIDRLWLDLLHSGGKK